MWLRNTKHNIQVSTEGIGTCDFEPQSIIYKSVHVTLKFCDFFWRHMFCWQRFVRRMATLNLAPTFVLFDNSRLMPAQGFSFALIPLTFITRTLQCNTTLTYNHPSHILLLEDTNHPAMWPAEMMQNIKWVIHTPLSAAIKRSPNAESAKARN